jgi:hypothetical protein
MKHLALFALAIVIAGCSQTLAPQGVSDRSPTDFFWTRAQLDSGLNYSMLRNSAYTVHPIYSRDGMHVEDGSINKQAFRILSLGDTISIDSLGANSLFSLPAGYYFGRDTTYEATHDSTYIVRDSTIAKIDTVGQKADTSWTVHTFEDSTKVTTVTTEEFAGSLNLLVQANLDSGASWNAGLLSGPGLGQGVQITARVLDHVTTLIDSTQTYGESYVIRYSHEDGAQMVAATLPLFWKVYYAKGVGPVLIQEFTGTQSEPNLQSQATLENK